jgi:predicted nucleic acid-binding protein
MPDRVFLDTNIFVYLYDSDNPDKQARARALLERLALSDTLFVPEKRLAFLRGGPYKQTQIPQIMSNDKIPDVRDGLTRQERIVLTVLHQAQKERGGRNVPTAMLWGRVCEHFYISPEELSEMLARLGARKG